MTAAVQELADRGYEDASLTRIAERAGVAKGLVWRYFIGKDDLMESTATMTMVTIRDGLFDVIDETLPVPDIIRTALRHVAGLIVTHRAELVALNHIVHNLRRPDGVERATADYFAETQLAQEELFRRGQADGTLRDVDTTVMATTYQGAIDSMLGYLGSHPDVDPNDYADTLADILLAGIQRADPG